MKPKIFLLTQAEALIYIFGMKIKIRLYPIRLGRMQMELQFTKRNTLETLGR